MTLISRYKLVQKEPGLEECICKEQVFCPVCGKPLKYRDKRVRVYRSYNGEKHRLIIRRLKCGTEGGCGRLHTELPAFIVPYKQYVSEIIENVVDGVSTPSDLTTEDYPCEKTMQRWNAWFFFNFLLLEMTARFLRCRTAAFREHVQKAGVSALALLRKEGGGWLSFLIRYIYNCGGRVPVRRR